MLPSSGFRFEQLPCEIRFRIYADLGLRTVADYTRIENFSYVSPTRWLDDETSLDIQGTSKSIQFYVPGTCYVRYQWPL